MTDPFKKKTIGEWMMSSTGSPGRKKNRTTIYVLIAVIALGLLGIVVIRPAIIGYSVYNKIDDSGMSASDFSDYVNTCKQETAEAEQKTADCKQEKTTLSTDLNSQIKSLTSAKESCEKERTVLQDKAEQQKTIYVKEIKSLDEEIADLQDKISSLQKDYNSLAENAANNICCKQKVDNPDIGYYAVVKSKIVCLEDDDDEDDAKAISCPK